MKYLKYLLGIIIVLFLLFILKGIITPSVHYESEVVVNKPVGEAWAVLTDETRLPEWIKGFKRTELVSGTPNTIGAVANVYVEDGDEEMIMEETITNIKPNELIAMTFSMDFMNMEYEMLLKENDGKTTIKSKSTTVGNGMFAKSIISFMTGAMKAQEDENLNSLKKVIEENTKNYFPETETEPAIETEE